ncbi:hypothetical protein ACE6H2_011023 [Prunus campanulata]
MPLPIWFKIQDLDKPPLTWETFFYPGIIVYHTCCIFQDVYGDNGSFMYHHGYRYAPYDTYATSLLNLLLNVNVLSNFD